MADTVKAKRPINTNTDDSDSGDSVSSPSFVDSPASAHQPPKKKRHIEVYNSDSDGIDETSSIQSTLNKDEAANSNINQQALTNNTNDQQQSETIVDINTTKENDRSPSPSSHDSDNGGVSHSIGNDLEEVNGGNNDSLETPTGGSHSSEKPQPQQSSQKQTTTPVPSQQQKQQKQQQKQQQQQKKKEVRKPRLVITKMVLNDFKSYAGRQVIGPFHKVRKEYTSYKLQTTWLCSVSNMSTYSLFLCSIVVL